MSEDGDSERVGPWCSLRCWGRTAAEQTAVTGMPAKATAARTTRWSQVAARWPVDGPEGITHTRTNAGADVLLYRLVDGLLVGVLHHYQSGRIGFIVHPAHRRQGIGKQLARSSARRWGLDLSIQAATEAGAAFARSEFPEGSP